MSKPYPVASTNKSPDTPQLGAYSRFKGDDYYCLSLYLLNTGAAATLQETRTA